MKQILLAVFAIFFLAEAMAQVKFVTTTDSIGDVILPKEVSIIEGRPKQKKPTNVIFQNNGEDIDVYGQIKLVSTLDDVSVYTCSGIDFGLSNHRYRMQGNILCTREGKKIEAIAVDTSTTYDCQKLLIKKDLTVKDAFPGKKLVVEVNQTGWSHTSYSVSPEFSASLVDTIDNDPNAFYTLAVKTSGDKVCHMFELERNESDDESPVKEAFYEISERERSKFSVNANNDYLLDDKIVTGFAILKDWEKDKRVTKKNIPHRKRTKI